MNFKHELFETIYLEGEFNFAGGATATRKLDWERVPKNSTLFDEVSDRLAELIIGIGSDCLVSTPSGADEITQSVGRKIGVPVFLLQKSEDKIIAPWATVLEVGKYKKPTEIDDIFTTGSTITRVLRQIPNITDVAVIWDRSDPEQKSREIFEAQCGKQVHALVHEFVPLN